MPDEIIVVDNNCSDKTVEIARGLGAKIVREEFQNIAASRNAGIKAARNEWIALLDSDDWWEKEKIKFQWEAVQLYPKAKIIDCEYNQAVFDEQNNLIQTVSPNANAETPDESNIYSFYPTVTEQEFAKQLVHTSTLLIHKDVFEKVGYYDERFFLQQDFEFILRAFAVFSLARVNRPLATYRRHPLNSARRVEEVIRARQMIVEEIHLHPDRYSKVLYPLFVEQVKREFVRQNFLKNQLKNQ